MIYGGPDSPYPRGCPQDCSLGPQYAQSTPLKRPWYYAVINVGTTVANSFNLCDGDHITASPNFMGIYPPRELANCGCISGSDLTDGKWAPGTYTLVAGQPNTVPTPTYHQAKTLGSFTQPSGVGSLYMVGDILNFTDGHAVPNGTILSATVIGATPIIDGDGGKITAVAFTDHGVYYDGYTPSGTITSTSGTGTGGSISITWIGATIDFGTDCQKRGFKDVAAQRQWQGVYGWTSQDYPSCGGEVPNSAYLVCATPTTDSNGINEGDTFTYCTAPSPNPENMLTVTGPWLPSYSYTFYLPYQSAPDQVKYRTMTWSDVSYYDTTMDDSYNVTTVTASITGSRTVNALSGEITSTISSSEIDTYTPAVDGAPGTVTMTTLDITNGNGTYDGVPFVTNAYSTVVDLATDFHCSQGPIDLMGAIQNWNNGGTIVEAACEDYSDDSGSIAHTISYSFLDPVTDWNSYSGSASFHNQVVVTGGTDSTTTTTVDNITISWTRTATTFTWYYHFDETITQTGTFAEPTYHDEITYYGTCTLSDENTASEVYADIESLLNTWDLTDDAEHPWRLNYSQIMPLVNRNEYGPQSPLGFNNYYVVNLEDAIDDADGNAPYSEGWAATYAINKPWFDPEIYQFYWPIGVDEASNNATALIKLYDGAILGAPLPGGYHGFFDWQFNNWATDFSCMQGYGGEVFGYNTANGLDLPLNTTQWTDASFAAGNPQTGAAVWYANTLYIGGDPGSFSISDGSMVAIKYAEIIEKWEAQGWEVGGAQKFWVDEMNVSCVASTDGTLPTAGVSGSYVLTLTTPISSMSGLRGSTTHIWANWTGAGVTGFYNGTVASDGTTLTLTALAYNTPSDWGTAGVQGQSGIKIADANAWTAPLRFADKTSLVGRQAVTGGVSVGGMVNFIWSNAQTAFGMSATTSPVGKEMIVIYDKFMGVLGTETATRTDDGNFTVATSTDYTTAAWITISGAPSWYKYSNYPRGNFVHLEWVGDERTGGELIRLAGIDTFCGDSYPLPTTNAGGGPTTIALTSFTQTQKCLPTITCAPRVMCYSPNGEVFVNGVTVPFPGSFVMDGVYGSRWSGAPQSTMTDYYWQGPHTPCDGTGLGMDNGACASYMPNMTTFGLLPLVEAELYPPGCNGFVGYGKSHTEQPTITGTLGCSFNKWPNSVTDATGPLAPSNTGGSPGGSEYVYRTHLIDSNPCETWNYINWFLI